MKQFPPVRTSPCARGRAESPLVHKQIGLQRDQAGFPRRASSIDNATIRFDIPGDLPLLAYSADMLVGRHGQLAADSGIRRAPPWTWKALAVSELW